MVATDRRTTIPLLQCNIAAYLSRRRLSNTSRPSCTSNVSGIMDQNAECHQPVKVVEFDWQQCCPKGDDILDDINDCLVDGILVSPSPSSPSPSSYATSASHATGTIGLMSTLRSLQFHFNGPEAPVCSSHKPSEDQDLPHSSLGTDSVSLSGAYCGAYPDILLCSDCCYASVSVKPLLQALNMVS